MRTARPLAATAVTAGAAGAALLFAATPAGAADNATVSILHGVPGVTVDVYANGEELLPDFAPGTLTEPLSLPAGDYDLAIYPAGADPSSTEPAANAEDVAVPAGANATVVAHLTADGTPVLTPFVNDVSTVPAGQARVTVRHAAAAPAVDVRADGAVVAPGLTNPNEASLVVPAGTVSADVTLSGTDTVAIGPADLPLPEGADTIVYAWGDGEAGYQLAVQTIGGMHSSPSGVPGGSAGLADDGGVPVPVIVLSTLGLGAAAVGARRLATSRV
ncbi:MAG: Lipoprotein [Modestobacter sp.]|nr:Lipoprotein [Modestobacter sp.]